MRVSERNSLLTTVILLLVAACVPLQTPPQVQQTPGPAVQITDRAFESEAFSLRYPVGWRVITSAAGDPPYAIFVAPDDAALIVIATESAPAPGLEGGSYTVERHIELGAGRTVTAVLHAPNAAWMTYRSIFDALVETVT
jgi:hypothetical protein